MLSPTEQLQEQAKESGLRYISDRSKGISRVKRGNSFSYLDTDGTSLKNPDTLNRIKKLRIPPAWKDVWICKSPNGHIQATGIDERGRKQYVYHADWISMCQQNKFEKMLDFSESLPRIRERIYQDMNLPGLSEKRVLATIVWLLEHTYIRIGNTEYAKENKSFGLTTLRNQHVDVAGDTVTFEFKGKSGVFHSVDISHPRVAKTIRKLEELPGYELFQYIDENKKRRVVDSSEVNNYLKEIGKGDISAKDFRTWGGTVLSAVTLKDLGEFETKTQLKKNLTTAVKTVCNHLRNTPSVCRSYYIHPTVLTTYENKILVPHFEKVQTKQANQKPRRLSLDEFSVRELLAQYS